jgi:UDPglucose 6-dehydrogenase
MLRITVVGAGYVGLANAVLLAQRNAVTLLDIDEHRIALVNDKKSPIADTEIEPYLLEKKLHLTATTDVANAYEKATFIIIAAPTNYDPNKNYFDTTIVETLISEALQQNPTATIVVKSTVPVGFTVRVRSTHPRASIIFSPEFLREGRALYDNLYPSRIVIGDKSKRAREFAALLQTAAIKKDMPVIFTGPTEAEAIKLFANTYLAMRVAYFNELDTYAELKQLSSREIIKGISTDPRIGDYYNNPSFGYGGYCLPKDSKQLHANFDGVPSTLIRSIITSNDTRIKHIADSILSRKPKVVGVHRLAMKAESDNFRESAIKHVIDHLHEAGVKVILFEPTLKDTKYEMVDVVEDFEDFIEQSDIIIANRLAKELEPVSDKVYTRDIFARD